MGIEFSLRCLLIFLPYIAQVLVRFLLNTTSRMLRAKSPYCLELHAKTKVYIFFSRSVFMQSWWQTLGKSFAIASCEKIQFLMQILQHISWI